MVPALKMVDSLEELNELADRPEAFLERLLTEAAGPAVKKLFLAELKREAVSLLANQGLTWEDALPVLEMMSSLEEWVVLVKAGFAWECLLPAL